jgi:hypothetical protein
VGTFLNKRDSPGVGHDWTRYSPDVGHDWTHTDAVCQRLTRAHPPTRDELGVVCIRDYTVTKGSVLSE